MPVAMSLTAGTVSGHTHTLRSITSPWEISVMFNPAFYQRRRGVHADDLGSGAIHRHRRPGNSRGDAVADRSEPLRQAQSGVEPHAGVDDGRRDQRRERREIDG